MVESCIPKGAVGFTVLQVPDQTSLVSDDEGTTGSVHGWLLQGPLHPVHCDISSSIFERGWLLGWNESKSIITLSMLFCWLITFDINNKHEPCLDLQPPDLTLTLLDWDSPSFQKCSYWEVRDLSVRAKFSLSFSWTLRISTICLLWPDFQQHQTISGRGINRLDTGEYQEHFQEWPHVNPCRCAY